MLNARRQKTNRSSKKFDYKNFKLYSIIKTIDNNVYEFKYSEVMKNMFSRFHF